MKDRELLETEIRRTDAPRVGCLERRGGVRKARQHEVCRREILTSGPVARGRHGEESGRLRGRHADRRVLERDRPSGGDTKVVGFLRVRECAVDVENQRLDAHATTLPRSRARQSLRRSISRQIMGVKMSCIARSILPPGQTMVLGRDMKESCSIDSR